MESKKLQNSIFVCLLFVCLFKLRWNNSGSWQLGKRELVQFLLWTWWEWTLGLRKKTNAPLEDIFSIVKNSRHSLCKTFLNDGLPSCFVPPIYKSFVWSAHCAVLHKLHYLCIIRYELLMDSTMRPNPLWKCHNRIVKPWFIIELPYDLKDIFKKEPYVCSRQKTLEPCYDK